MSFNGYTCPYCGEMVPDEEYWGRLVAGEHSCHQGRYYGACQELCVGRIQMYWPIPCEGDEA